MNRLLVSAVNTSMRTESSVGSVSMLTSPTRIIDVPTVTAASATNVRVVRSLSSSARSKAVMSAPP